MAKKSAINKQKRREATDPELSVTVADRSEDALKRATARAERLGGQVETIVADLAEKRALEELIGRFDVVVGALASHIGFPALKTVLEAGKPYCDISFMPEDAWELDELARSSGVTAVVDFGVAPGMSNVLAARGTRMLDECRSIAIYVGGLPAEPRWPHHYKAGFAPADVIEEYTRPARIVEHGEVVVRAALADPEFLEFDSVGTLEALTTDGLRSLTETLKVPFMKEKTLRYPEHANLMRALQALGLFEQRARHGRRTRRRTRRRLERAADPAVDLRRGRGRPDGDARRRRGPAGRRSQAARLGPLRSFRPRDRDLEHGSDDGFPLRADGS